MSCIAVKYTRLGGDMKVTFTQVCGTNIDVVFLADSQRRKLQDSESVILTTNKE